MLDCQLWSRSTSIWARIVATKINARWGNAVHICFFLWLCVYSFLHIKVMKIDMQRQFGPELWNCRSVDLWICGTLVAAKINEQEIGSATNINALHTFYFSLSSILWLYVHSFSQRSYEDWSVILVHLCWLIYGKFWLWRTTSFSEFPQLVRKVCLPQNWPDLSDNLF